jgi:hypothetical protein
MSVDVGTGAAWIKGTSSVRQGIYDFYNDAVANLAVGANGGAAGTYRIDQIIARVYDSTDGGSAQDTGTLEILPGSSSNAFGSATLALNARTGAAALPAHSIRIADIAVVGGAASITNAAIRDRRPWAWGAQHKILRNANAAAANDYVLTTGATVAEIDATNLKPRIECSGNPLRVTLAGRVNNSFAGTSAVRFAVFLDGSAGIDGNPNTEGHFRSNIAQSQEVYVSLSYVFTPSVGSHQISWAATADTGSASLYARSTIPVVMTIEELARQTTANNPAGYA